MRLHILLISIPALIAAPVSYLVVPAWFAEGIRYWVVDSFVRVVVPLLCLYVLHRRGVALKDYGLPRSLGNYKIAEFCAICFFCTLGLLGYILVDNIVRLYLGNSVTYTGSRLGRDGFGMLTVLYYATTAAFFEEIFFRGILGYVFLKDRSRVNTIAYVCVSSLFFVVVHHVLDLASIISYFYYGIVSAVIYVLLRTLWPLVIAHFITDVVVLTWWLRTLELKAGS